MDQSITRRKDKKARMYSKWVWTQCTVTRIDFLNRQSWIYDRERVWKYFVFNDVINLLQGLLIFIVLVCKKSVLAKLRDKAKYVLLRQSSKKWNRCSVAGSATANGGWRLVSAQLWAILFMKIQNNIDSTSMPKTKFDWQLGRYEPSSNDSWYFKRFFHIKSMSMQFVKITIQFMRGSINVQLTCFAGLN